MKKVGSSNTPAVGAAKKPLRTHLTLAGISAVWLARTAFQTALTIYIIPLQVRKMVGDEQKGTALGMIGIGGGLMTVFACPFFGMISDQFHPSTSYLAQFSFFRIMYSLTGRRIPFVILGTFFGILPTFAMYYIAQNEENLLWYGLAFCLVGLFDSLASAPYSALIPDVVDSSQFGSASGWMGMMTMLGSLVGGGLIGVLINEIQIIGCFVLLSILAVVSLISTTLIMGCCVNHSAVELRPTTGALSSEINMLSISKMLEGTIKPFRSRNFRWVFIMRFLMMMGFSTVSAFTEYYMADVVGVKTKSGLEYSFLEWFTVNDTEKATSLFIGFGLIGSFASTLISGMLSDQYGRRPIVIAAGVFQCMAPFGFIFWDSFSFVLLMAIFFGMGYGAYVSIDWALASDNLPSTSSHAKDLGVWHMALALPMVIGPPIAGRMLDVLQPFGASLGVINLGWKILWLFCGGLFIAGTLCIWKLKEQPTISVEPSKSQVLPVEELASEVVHIIADDK